MKQNRTKMPRRKVIILTGLDYNPILTQTRELDEVSPEAEIVAPGGSVLMHIFHNTPEGVIGTTYRTTENGDWRSAAFIGEKTIQSAPLSAAGLLQVARTLLTEAPEGKYRLSCDKLRTIEPLSEGAWWGKSGKRITHSGGVSTEMFAQGVGNPDGILKMMVDHDGLEIPQVCWGVPFAPNTEEWLGTAEYAEVQPSLRSAVVGSSFFRGLTISATNRLLRQKARGYSPHGKTGTGRQISGLYQDLEEVTKLFCTSMAKGDSQSNLEQEHARWHKTSALYGIHVMIGSQALSAAITIWGRDLGIQNASTVLTNWSQQFLVDQTVPGVESLDDFCDMPGGDRVRDLAAHWATANITAFRSSSSALKGFISRGATTDSWMYGDIMNGIPKGVQEIMVPVMNLRHNSPIVVTEKNILRGIRLESPETVRGR